MQMKKIENKESVLNSLKLVVDGIAQTFGPRCEVVLHDLRKPNHSVIKIANGHVTGRQLGSPITDYGLKLLSSEANDNLFINYSTTANNGRQLKSSSFLFRDEENIPFAALCINFDVTEILNLNKIIENIFQPKTDGSNNEPIETFQSDITSMLNNSINKVIKETGKSLPSMNREDRKSIVAELETQGFFAIKGAINILSKRLGISKFTVYNYLNSVKSENN